MLLGEMFCSSREGRGREWVGRNKRGNEKIHRAMLTVKTGYVCLGGCCRMEALMREMKATEENQKKEKNRQKDCIEATCI